MIQEQYVSFETAKLLKEKGFDEPTREYCEEELWGNELTKKYTFKHLYCAEDEPFFNSIQGADEHKWSAPTQQMVMRWLRELYNLHIEISPLKHYISNGHHKAVPSDKIVYSYEIYHIDQWDDVLEEFNQHGSFGFSTCEEACESAIKYCLENLIK